MPAQLVGGSKVKASAVVQLTNRLGAALSDVVNATIFASTDGVLDEADVQIAAMTKRVKIAAGKSKTLRVKLTAVPEMPAGPFQLLAKIDRVNSGGSDIVTAAGAFNASSPFVDLRAAPPVTTTNTLTLGKKARVKVALSNLGNVASSAGDVLALYARSKPAANQSASDAIPLASTTLRLKLQPSQTGTASLSFTVPAGLPPGTYELVAVVATAGETPVIADSIAGTAVVVGG